jgi:hypothetical protein
MSMLTRRRLLKMLGIAAGSRALPAFADAISDCKKTVRNTSTLFYKPASGTLYDTWIYHHRGTFFLYYLSAPVPERGWDSIAMATSADGVRWKKHGRIIEAASDVSWIGDGETWSVTDASGQEKFIMAFSEWRGPDKGGRQTLFFAESRDLLQWTRLGSEYEFQQDERWYEPKGRWDGLWTLPRPGGGRYGYWTGTPKGRPGFGFGESLDGMKWEALAPPQTPGTDYSPEIGAIHEWQGKYYIMAGSESSGASGDDGLFGMTILVGDAPFGPFKPVAKNRRLLAGNNAYFSRFVNTPEGVLVNYHSWEIKRGQPAGADLSELYLAPLKRADWDTEGTLRLAWWPGCDKVKTRPLSVELNKAAPGRKVVFLKTAFDQQRPHIFEGVLTLPKTPGAISAGLYFESEDSKAPGTAFIVRPQSIVDYGSMHPDRSRFEKEGSVDRDLQPGSSMTFRLVRKGRITEFYLDDFLMQCYCLPESGSGRVGLLGDAAGYRELKAWNCV